MHLVSRQTQCDEITGNRLTQCFSYRGGHYDRRRARVSRLSPVAATDRQRSERGRSVRSAGFTAPILSKTWFHTGEARSTLPGTGYYDRDTVEAESTCGPHCCRTTTSMIASQRNPSALPDDDSAHEIARALSGRVLRSEVLRGRRRPEKLQCPTSVQEHRARRAGAASQRPTPALRGACNRWTWSRSATSTSPRSLTTRLCQHQIKRCVGRISACSVHEFTVHYARRKTVEDTPPFSDDHQQDLVEGRPRRGATKLVPDANQNPQNRCTCRMREAWRLEPAVSTDSQQRAGSAEASALMAEDDQPREHFA
jgi:hypothetical protein